MAEQFERARQAILKYKDNPAVLVWGIGNEMEGENGDDPAIWHAVQDIAALAHKLDPNHPTMMRDRGNRRASASLPSISTALTLISMASIPTAEFSASPNDTANWAEPSRSSSPSLVPPARGKMSAERPWRAPIELTSTAKADVYRTAYAKTILAEKGKLCLGSYCFLWGNKEEATATWFGMFLPDGSRLEAVDAISQLWTGNPPAVPCPKILSLKVDHDQVRPGAPIHATLDTANPSGHPLTVKWVLTVDPARYITGGQHSRCRPRHRRRDRQRAISGAPTFKCPRESGPYWLYAYVRDDAGGAATAVVPLDVSDSIGGVRRSICCASPEGLRR